MGDRLTNIFKLSVTLFLCACSVESKLDQNLAEMRAMNENMAAMNKNMANGINEFSDVGKSVKTLSDEAVIFLKKTDPQQYFDMFNKISDKFEGMLAGLMDQTGDIKTFIDQANQCTELFLAYSKALTPEDMGTIKESFDKISGMTTQINELLAKSGNYEAMANQVFLTTQMFTAVGLSLGQSLDVMDPKDTDAMMEIMRANMKNFEMLGTTGDLAKQMMTATERVVNKSDPRSSPEKNNKLRRIIDALPGFITNLSEMWDAASAKGESLNEWLYKRDGEYRKLFCLGMAYANGITQYPPTLDVIGGLATVKESPKSMKMKKWLNTTFKAQCKGKLDIDQMMKELGL